MKYVTYENREAWLAARKNWVGASEVASIILPEHDRPKWMRSPYAVWALKRGVIDNVVETPLMRWGQKLEGVIADEAVEQLRETFPAVLAKECTYQVWQHPDAPLAATPDRLLYLDTHTIALLECKFARAAAAWTDGPPLYYQIQVQAQLACTGLSRAWIAALIGGYDFRLYEQTRNDAFIHRMLEAVRRFWAHVESGDPPEIDGAESTSDAIAARYFSDNGETVMLSPEFVDLDERLQQLKTEIAERTREESEILNKIKTAIGDAKYGMLPHCRYSYSTVDVPEKQVTVPAKHYRVLRRAERE